MGSGRFWTFTLRFRKVAVPGRGLSVSSKSESSQAWSTPVSDVHAGLTDAIQEQLPGSIWTRCHTEGFLGSHFRRNVLEETPEACFEAMQAVTGVVLKADSQPEAFEAFEEVLAGERTRIVETSEGETVDTCEQLREEAGAALNVLEEGLEEAAAVLALPGKYRRRLRTTKGDPTAHRRASQKGEGSPDLPQHRFVPTAVEDARGTSQRDSRGVVHRPAKLLRHGRIRTLEEAHRPVRVDDKTTHDNVTTC
jgi:hypothetical protein